MMIRSDKLSRRTVLRGAGITMALPLFDAMLPTTALGERKGGEDVRPPRRAAFIYIPNGVVEDAWTPTKVGNGFDLTRSLAPLRNVRDDLNVLSHLDRQYVGGTGVHAQAGACWLTSSAPTEVLDGGFPTNTSIDQFLARSADSQTLLPSLELSCNNHPDNKETKYFESISWYGPGYAANVEKDPRQVFERLFGNPAAGGQASVLDTVLADAQSLRGRLGKSDQRKLDEYLGSVRATEKRIAFAQKLAARRGKPPIEKPSSVPEDRGAYIRLMNDLMALAFQLDLTRVATLVIDPERWDSPRTYHGVFDKPQNHHVLTHTKGDEAKEKLRRIDHFHVRQFAHLVETLKSMREGEGSVLDNSVIAFGSGLSDGRVHDYGNLSVLLAGRAGGRIATGRHLAYPKGTPLANLWLTLLHTLDAPQKRFADSTGVLKDLAT